MDMYFILFRQVWYEFNNHREGEDLAALGGARTIKFSCLLQLHKYVLLRDRVKLKRMTYPRKELITAYGHPPPSSPPPSQKMLEFPGNYLVDSPFTLP